jgi:hypothetical protein
MPFLVKATGRTSGVFWLAPAPPGYHTFGPRREAIVFGKLADAQAAADKASKSFMTIGMIFSVESAGGMTAFRASNQ